jgi:hypothetical protein
MKAEVAVYQGLPERVNCQIMRSKEINQLALVQQDDPALGESLHSCTYRTALQTRHQQQQL